MDIKRVILLFSYFAVGFVLFMRDRYLLTTMPTYPFTEYNLLFYLMVLSGLLGVLSWISECEFGSECGFCSDNCRCIMLGLFSFADLIVNCAHLHLELKTTAGFCGWKEQQGRYSIIDIVLWIAVCVANICRCGYAAVWLKSGCSIFTGLFYVILTLVNVLPSFLCNLTLILTVE